MKPTLRSKIVVGMWIITTFSTVAAAVLSGHLIIRSHRDGVKEQLQTAATSLISLEISKFSELDDFEQIDSFITETLQMERVNKIIRIYDTSQKLVFTTVGLDYDLLPATLEETIEKPTFQTLVGKQRKYESLVMPYRGMGKQKPFFLQIAIPSPQYYELLKSLWLESLLLLTLLVSISLALSHWLARRLLKPVEKIAGHLIQMDPNKIEEWGPIWIDQKDQYLQSIVDAINLLTQRTRQAVQHIRKMGRYVAHELRTPLTILQGEAETVLSKKNSSPKDYEKVVHSSLEEFQRMSDIVTTVLKVGEKEVRASFSKTSAFDLGSWVLGNKERWQKTLGREIRTEIKIKEKAEVFVDYDLLYRLADNLVRNIRDHTPPQTPCTMLLLRNKGEIIFQIEDAGPGLPPTIIDSLNIKKDSSEGVGIGLDLCYKIARLCSVELIFSNREPTGLVAEIRF